MVHATMTSKAGLFHYFLHNWVLHWVLSCDLLSCCSPTTIPHPGVFLLPEEGVIFKLCCFDNFISVFSLGLSLLAELCVELGSAGSGAGLGSGHGRLQVDVSLSCLSGRVCWMLEVVVRTGVQAGLGFPREVLSVVEFEVLPGEG